MLTRRRRVLVLAAIGLLGACATLLAAVSVMATSTGVDGRHSHNSVAPPLGVHGQAATQSPAAAPVTGAATAQPGTTTGQPGTTTSATIVAQPGQTDYPPIAGAPGEGGGAVAATPPAQSSTHGGGPTGRTTPPAQPST
ncbi:MAG TPA: hypothetical protein VKB75_08610, partial [Jatrophihabitans sp.]|nr:hypothetical protein [Jatrophihabitans sp.]